MTAPSQRHPGSAPDYWDFIDAAEDHINLEFPESDTLANRLFLSLNRASSTVVYDFDSSVHRPAGGSWARFRLLLALWVKGATPAHVLASLTGMSRATVSNLANPLMDNGLVRKSRSSWDRRSIDLTLTKSGTQYVQEMFKKQNEKESLWSSALSESEIHLFISLLNKLMKHRESGNVRRRS